MYDVLQDTMVWIKDRQLRYQWANLTFLLNFSFSDRSDIVGKTDHDFTPVYLADLYQADDAQVLAGTNVVARVEPVVSIEALPCWNQTWKRPLHGVDGEIIGALGLSRRLPSTDAPDFPFPDLIPILDHMRQYCGESITNTELADLANLSVGAFERKFKRHIKMTPTQFLGRLRITRAAADLCNTSDSIVAVADRHGFSDQSHLTREFRKHFGSTPGAYRALYQRGGD